MASFVSAERVAQLERAAELERERANQMAMHCAALESHMAERMFVFDARLCGTSAPVTYERMYTLRHNALLDAHALLGRVRRLLHQQRLSRAVAVLNDEMGSEDEPEASEEESSDDDPVVAIDRAESMAQSLLADVARVSPPEWQPFSGRGSRLD